MSVFEVRIEGDAHVVLSGELDMVTSPELTNAVESLASTESKQGRRRARGVPARDSVFESSAPWVGARGRFRTGGRGSAMGRAGS